MGKISYLITDMRELPSAVPARQGQKDIMLTWREDGQRVYNLTLPAEGFDRAAAIRLIEAEVAKRAELIGHSGAVER